MNIDEIKIGDILEYNIYNTYEEGLVLIKSSLVLVIGITEVSELVTHIKDKPKAFKQKQVSYIMIKDIAEPKQYYRNVGAGSSSGGYCNKHVKKMLGCTKLSYSITKTMDMKELKKIKTYGYTRGVPIKRIGHWDEKLFQDYINHPYKKIVNPDLISK